MRKTIFSLMAAWSLATACGGDVTVHQGQAGAGGSGGGATSTTTVGTGAGSNFGDCDGPGQCTLTYPGCCPGCSEPTLDDQVAVASDQVDAFHESECPEGQACPDCEACDSGTLLAYCDAGQCTGAHVDDLDLRGCEGPEDCRLRWGTACFEPCSGNPFCSGLISVNDEAEATLAPLVCDPNAPPPPPCVPTYPEDAIADCVDGRCEAVFLE